MVRVAFCQIDGRGVRGNAVWGAGAHAGLGWCSHDDQMSKDILGSCFFSLNKSNWHAHK